jgi:hypothetical protein
MKLAIDQKSGLVIDPNTGLPIDFPDDSYNAFKKMREIDELRKELDRQKKEIETLKARPQPTGSKAGWEKAWYFVPLLVAAALTGYLVYRGWAEKPAVTIEFNVGEIIGGLLAGVGALMAGLAYFFKTKD